AAPRRSPPRPFRHSYTALFRSTPFRHFVMGEESMERAASASATQRIAALLHEAMAAGAMGFSTTTLAQHIGFRGQPLACRLASQIGRATSELQSRGHLVCRLLL